MSFMLYYFFALIYVTHLCYNLILLQEILGFMLHSQMVFQLLVADTRQLQLELTALIVQHG